MRQEEQSRAKTELDKARKDHEGRMEILENKIKRLEGELLDLNRKMKDSLLDKDKGI